MNCYELYKKNKKMCCGCKMCMDVCPTDSIRFEEDDEGFWYPIVSKDKCINCELCYNNCTFTKQGITRNVKEVYSAKYNDSNICFGSSSGAVFVALAQYVLQHDGVVYGAGVINNEVVHYGIESEDRIAEFCKSKYVQSDSEGIYSEVEMHLVSGRSVLFSGTPCQVRALKNYMEFEYDNLYCVDVICTGVSSPGVWKEFLKQIEMKYGKKIEKVVFRDKTVDNNVLFDGQRNLTMKYIFDDGEILYRNKDDDKFFDGFLAKLFLRPSCYECRVKSFSSGSDIQLGDFWELENAYPDLMTYSNEGVIIPFGISEVLICTNKGKRLFLKSAENRLIFDKLDLDRVKHSQLYSNWYLLTDSSVPHWNRDCFFSRFKNHDEQLSDLICDILLENEFNNIGEKKIGLWGSYNLRECIRRVCDKTNCELVYQFRNSNVESAVSRPINLLDYEYLENNEFRKNMMKYDFNKELIYNIVKYAKETNVFVFDFLEERYETLDYKGGLVTKTEAFYEQNEMIYTKTYSERWENSIARFLNVICNNYSEIYMVEMYLNHEYGLEHNKKKMFLNYNNIIECNKMLLKKYNYIKNNWKNIKVINEIPDELEFSDKFHIYGCKPEHLNESAYRYITKKIVEKLLK